MTTLLAGCDGLEGPNPSRRAEVQSGLEQPGREQPDLRVASVKIAVERVHQAARIGERMPFPPRLPVRNCGPKEVSGPLVLDVDETNSDGKRLLPLAFVEQLRVDPLAALDALRTPLEGPSVAPFRSEQELSRARELLDGAASTRFKAVVHVTRYREAALVWSLQKRKRVWVEGSLMAWLVIHDLETTEALCATFVQVRNEVSEISTRVRLKQDSRQRLTAELASDTRLAVARAVTALAPGIVLPPSWGTAVAAADSPAVMAQR